MVSTLLQAGADKNEDIHPTDEDFYDGVPTPLYIAARAGHAAIVSALVGAGAATSAARNNSAAPLYIAAKRGHEAVMAALLGAGSDKN